MTKATILVVEDDPLQRRLIRESLEAAGYDVFEASTREEALAMARRRPPEIAVVDYKLGQDTGTAVVRDLLAEDPLLTPIMVTAFGNIERAVEAIRAGAYDYIVKPIDPTSSSWSSSGASSARASAGRYRSSGATWRRIQFEGLRRRLGQDGGGRPAHRPGGPRATPPSSFQGRRALERT